MSVLRNRLSKSSMTNESCLKRAVAFPRRATLDGDAWGVSVQLEPETDHEPFTVSGAWEILSVWANRLGAAYVGWGISVPPNDE